jgi:glycosyltransferase involved in cell wall biosynthesis
MAMKKTVVATPGAATGLKAVSGEELFVVENKEEMSALIIDLLADKDTCQRIGENARRYVEREHSWDAHLGRLSELISESGCQI